MKRFFVLCVVVLVGIVLISASLPGKKMQDIQYPQKLEKADVKTSERVKRAPDFGKIPLYFIPNKGQVDALARFYARTSRYTLWMTKKGLVFDSIRQVEVKAEVKETHSTHSPESLERDVSRFVFLESNQNPGIVPLEMTQHRVNYFKGSDPTKWQKGIQTSKVVLYKNVYRNIDLKVYGVESQLEYDWIVKPGANPNDIRFKYTDVSKTCIDKEGNLVVETKFGKMIHKKPISYQVIEGEKVAVQSTFKKTGKNTYGFKIEAYNRNYELIIDPMVAITYSTYLGGSGNENWKWIGDGSGIAVDCEGYIYVSGYTKSGDFPTKNCCQCSFAGFDDIFITKFTPDGQDLVYSTYLGGNNLDRCYD
ncbi:MAG: hypothetical protein GTO45_33110, partial [Candidatus Aminicenantes bacterium]|nr:hypothetical protein [Candidatus Aminicenantes bacterium]NIM83580.1 hypothetical protein [Candidatus Aminicenantes bacterium]NIN22981.1 hypothetical protein [Candidatus Aminicenantes bacterium]NIN46718.1 hypothetical protein [Candidatus Aminicenantes bacterium]NIN89624.1 hypothetical protein [Candidatus Aminicenantes bacterium]